MYILATGKEIREQLMTQGFHMQGASGHELLKDVNFIT
jgi:hypothetical protein